MSIQQLQHEVLGKVIKQWEKAEDARAKGQFEKAIKHLRKAIEIDPEFVAARNNLAAILLTLDKSEEATIELEKCVKVDPHSPMAISNIAVAYIMQQKFADAERAARRAIDLDRTGSRARMILGLTLVMQDQLTEEALRALQWAQSDFPQAQLLSGRIYAARGQREQAISAIRDYLARGSDTTAQHVARDWLATLEQ